jgi:hypothetical protein
MNRPKRYWYSVAAICAALAIPATAYYGAESIIEIDDAPRSYDIVRVAPVAEEAHAPAEPAQPMQEPQEPAPEPVLPTEPVTAAEQITIPAYAAEMIGRTIWGEAGGIADPAERAAVAWCILNRVDEWNASIRAIVTAPDQFHGYLPEGECPQEHIDLAADVLARWAAEKAGADDVGRVLPAEYLYFWGDGEHNWFRTSWKGNDYWDWSMPSPY